MTTPNLAVLRSELEPEADQTAQALTWLRDVFQIVTDTDLERAGALLQDAKARYKQLEERRTSLTKPLLEVKRGIDALFAPVTKPLAAVEDILKGKIAGYHLARENERRALMASSAAEYAAGGMPTAPIPEPAKVQGVTVTAVWDCEITDPGMVPRDLCSPDIGKILATVPEFGEPQAIPGVRWFERGEVRARASR